MMKKILMLMVVAAILIGMTAPVGSADNWPTKPITIIVPYAAGGSADRLARGVAPFLEKELGVSFIIENRPGASGQIGATMFLEKPADGNTILLTTFPALSTSIVVQGANYSLDDFAVINAENFGTQSITVHSDSPYQTFDELIKAIKDNPGKIKLGALTGTASQLMAFLVVDRLKLEPIIVWYNSGAPIRTALLGKHIDFSINGAVTDSTLKPKARALALSTKTKYTVWPDSPFINDVAQKYNVQFPEIGDIRCFLYQSKFKKDYPDRWNKVLAAYKKVLESDGYKAYTEKIGTAVETKFRGPENSMGIMMDMHHLVEQYKVQLSKKKN